MRAELDSTPTGSASIRRELRSGDVAAVIDLHRRLYLAEYGLDESFVSDVAAGIEEAADGGWPAANEGVWLVEHEGEVVGALGLTNQGGAEARLRWVVLVPELRGRGLGRQMVSEAVALARESGYERMALETFSDLHIAAAIYRSLGFEPVWERTGPKWGRAELTYQRYELRL